MKSSMSLSTWGQLFRAAGECGREVKKRVQAGRRKVSGGSLIVSF